MNTTSAVIITRHHRRSNSATTYQQQLQHERHARHQSIIAAGSRLKRTLSLSLTGTAIDHLKQPTAVDIMHSIREQQHQLPRLKSILKTSSLRTAISINGVVSMAVAPGTPVRKVFRFNEIVLVGETHSKHDYERKSDFVMFLPPHIAHMIKKELNDFKSTEMEVHQESAHNTHLYLV
jgi:hypothetical protein